MLKEGRVEARVVKIKTAAKNWGEEKKKNTYRTSCVPDRTTCMISSIGLAQYDGL